MLETSQVPLPGEGGQHLRFFDQGQALSFRSVLEAWVKDASFRAQFSSILRSGPPGAFRWETPPVTLATLDRAFECVLLPSPWLDVPPSSSDFAEHFESSDQSVLTFPNLGADALLVAPRPAGPAEAYAHLASFLRKAQPAQVDAFWIALGHAAQARLSKSPIWISTAGGGVPWLHARLDSSPKYYGHAPFRDFHPVS